MRFLSIFLSTLFLCQSFLFSQTRFEKQILSGNTNFYKTELMEKIQQAAINPKKNEMHSNRFEPDYFLKKNQYRRFLDTYIREFKDKVGCEGVSISVISNNDLLFRRGYGYSDKEKKIPVTPYTLFKVGSVSKVFTGIAIMQLVEQGRIDLDAPLTTYIPEFSYKSHFPDDIEPITVRTLMTHQSGLVGFILKGSISSQFQANDFNELVSYYSKEYLAYPPRYITSYSNSGVALLGIVIEQVTGIKFEQYIKINICNPIGMSFSHASLKKYMLPHMAKSYTADGNEFPHLSIREVPAVSFISSSLEMTLFMKMILNGGKLFGHQILKENTLNQMFEQQNSNIPLDFPDNYGKKWGLSWMLGNSVLEYAGKYAGHGGQFFNYWTMLHILPEHGFAVIVQTNSETGYRLSYKVADMAMIKALEIFKGINKPDPEAIPPIVPLESEHIMQMIGTFNINNNGCMFIDTLYNKLYIDGVLELVPHTDNWFSLQEDGQPIPGYEHMRIKVQQYEGERLICFEFRNSSGIFRGTVGVESEIPEEPHPEWLARVGEYTVVNPDMFSVLSTPVAIIITPQNIFHYIGGSDVYNVLDPINSYEILRSGRGSDINETIQIVDYNGEEHLYRQGYFLKKQQNPSFSLKKQRTPSFINQIKKRKKI